jgi:uncharacterized membrane protein
MSASRAIWSRPDAAAAGLLAAAAAFAGAWALLHTSFFPPATADTNLYEHYGTAVRAGELPYRDFGLVYPPGALPVFVAPAFLGVGYLEAFGWLMAALGVACVVLVVLGDAEWWGIAFVAVSPLLVGALAWTRFDFWPATLTAAAVVALLRDRDRFAWALLGAAVAAKVYPAVLVPLAVAWTWRRRGPRELAFSAAIGAGVVALAFAPFAVAAPHGLWRSLSNQLARPLQIESLAASALAVAGHPQVVTGHGSQNLAGHGVLAALSSAVALAFLVSLWVAFARGPAERDRLVRHAAACVCAFVAFGKVLSPQYLIWLVPLVPLVRGRRGLAATAILGAALVATQVWFPVHYWSYAASFRRAPLVLARNVFLVALLVVLSCPTPRALRRSPSRATPGPSASSA